MNFKYYINLKKSSFEKIKKLKNEINIKKYKYSN